MQVKQNFHWLQKKQSMVSITIHQLAFKEIFDAIFQMQMDDITDMYDYIDKELLNKLKSTLREKFHISRFSWSLFFYVQSKYRKIRTRRHSIFGNF